MTDRFRSPLDRRALLAGLLVGTGAAISPALARAEEKIPPPPSPLESVEITARQLTHFELAETPGLRLAALEVRELASRDLHALER